VARHSVFVRFVYPLDEPPELTADELTRLLGGKAANLAMMTRELGLPVPPGFVITTEACREYLTKGWPAGLDREMHEAMRAVEARLGRGFGDAARPLLVSVRSGAPVSMPGMMDTILNVGLNDETTDGLAAMSGDRAFAEDCRRRLQSMFKATTGTAEPEDVWQQLRAAVEAVFRSWNSERARAYREREHIADDLGTGVTVQAMVFGNLSGYSGTGVVFTRNPASGEPALFGDVLFAAQGEDVVAGTHHTEPVAVLDERMPEVGAQLHAVSRTLERHLKDLADIEFTIEQGKLWLLQVRVGKRSPRAALRMAVDMAEDPDFPLTRAEAVERVAGLLEHPPKISSGRAGGAKPLTRGLAASPGVASGEIALSADLAVAAGRPMILVRSETSPQDVRGMARAAGVLTSRGGLVSHAAVIAREWGIPAVVGAAEVQVGENEVRIGGAVLKPGDVITVDGDSGEVFAGAVAGETVTAPEAATLLGWARAEKGAGPDDPLRALLIKGSISEEPAGLVSEGLVVEGPPGEYRLTASGRAAAQAALGADQQRWGVDRAGAALEAFHQLDLRVKEVVTAWQLRGSALNDHSDAAYDAGVIGRLAAIHRDASAWITSVDGAPPGLRRYASRLDDALGRVTGGDHRFVASPRVDSYHSVWFELHEELILLAGRNRADEAAAGRA
jgi:pyruvate,orthophosphate dikinase